MAKHPNPVKGAIRCPVCLSASTVHQVGEGQLIATGEPPKNSRNLGLLYYRCPECGNSSISKRVSEFITANMVGDETKLVPLETTRRAVLEGELITEEQPLPLTEDTEHVTVTSNVDEASNSNASSTIETGEETNGKTSFFSIKRVLMLFGVLLFLVWMVRQLMPNQLKESEEVKHEHAAA